MGTNAGFYGSLRFPRGKLATWRAAKLDAGAFRDFTGPFRSRAKLASVDVLLADLAASEPPEIYEVGITGDQVALFGDCPEDDFGEVCGLVAAAARIAAAHGARGSVTFIATAGSDETEAYEVKVGAGTSSFTALAGATLRKAYSSAGYRAWATRAAPQLSAEASAALNRFSSGTTVAPGSADHAEVVRLLARHPAAAIHKAAKKPFLLVPDGKTQRSLHDLYKTGDAMLAAFKTASIAELRGAALDVLSRLDRETARAPALRALDSPDEAHAAGAARALAGLPGVAVLDALLAALDRPTELVPSPIPAALAHALGASPEPTAGARLVARIEREIDAIASGPKKPNPKLVRRRHELIESAVRAVVALRPPDGAARLAALEQREVGDATARAWPQVAAVLGRGATQLR